MSEEKVPLCDCHYRKMVRQVSTLFPAGVFKCVFGNCGRYYATRYGYFNLIAGELTAEEKILDPADRQDETMHYQATRSLLPGNRFALKTAARETTPSGAGIATHAAGKSDPVLLG